jgi:hypothetical protein
MSILPGRRKKVQTWAHFRQLSTFVEFVLGRHDIRLHSILAKIILFPGCYRMNTGKRPPMAGEVLEITEAVQYKYSPCMWL